MGLRGEEIKIGYDGSVLLELSLRIRRGQKIAVIGDNGIGKSTFLKTVAGLIPPIKGTSQLGSNLLVGYFDQQSALIDSDKTVRDHFTSFSGTSGEGFKKDAWHVSVWRGKCLKAYQLALRW